MAYRDEKVRLRVRITELEEQLVAERGKLARLEGRGLGDGELAAQFFGGPKETLIERTVAGSVADATDDILDTLSDCFEVEGDVFQTERRLTWKLPPTGGRQVQISLLQRGGEVRVRVREPLGGYRGRFFGGVMGGVGGGLSFVVVALAARFGISMLVAVPLWTLAVYAVARRLYRKRCLASVRQLEQVADEVVAALTARRKARIETDSSEEEAVAAEEEAVALEERQTSSK